MRQRAMGVPPGPVEVRESLEELGPTFIKLGQLLSTRPDLIPQDYANELETLQDKAPPVPYDSVRRMIEDEFGHPVELVFASFDREPLASASLGQTHLAKLYDGSEVVVKVQRPDITGQINTDLEIMSGVAQFLEQHFEQARIYGLTDLVDEFSISIHQELDYTKEARNGDRLRENFADWPQVKIATTDWDYTTTRVLTQERLCGIKITDLTEIDKHGYDRVEIARSLSRAFLKMVFVDGFFHADPHPGNVVVLEDNVIGLLDYGQMGRLDAELKQQITVLLSEYIHEDSAGFAEVLIDMGTAPSDLDRYAYTHDIDRLLRQYYDVPVSEVSIGDMLRRSFQVSARHRVEIPASIALLAKAVLEVESIDRVLDPNYNLSRDARQFIERSIRSELTSDKLKTQLLQNMLSWKNLLLSLPHRTGEVLEKMAENRFRIIFKHEGLEVAGRDFERSANRLSVALMVTATIIGSALVLSANVGPAWRGYSVVGLVGFGISFIFGIWLIISIIRAGNLW